MSSSYSLDEVLSAYLKDCDVKPDQVLGAKIRSKAGESYLSVVVDHGVGGGKHYKVPVSELRDTSEGPSPVSTQRDEFTDFSEIPGISRALSDRINEAGVTTWKELSRASWAGTLSNVPGIGQATVEKVLTFIENRDKGGSKK